MRLYNLHIPRKNTQRALPKQKNMKLTLPNPPKKQIKICRKLNATYWHSSSHKHTNMLLTTIQVGANVFKTRIKEAVSCLSGTLSLTRCILVDSSTVICWMSPFVILGMSDVFCRFIQFLMENPVSKQCRPG